MILKLNIILQLQGPSLLSWGAVLGLLAAKLLLDTLNIVKDSMLLQKCYSKMLSSIMMKFLMRLENIT